MLPFPILTEKKMGRRWQQLQTVAQLSISSSKLNLYIELMIVELYYYLYISKQMLFQFPMIILQHSSSLPQGTLEGGFQLDSSWVG